MLTLFKSAGAPVLERPPASYGAKYLFVSPDYQRFCIYLLLAVGVGLRVFHYQYNRSFFIDELFLNVNLIKMNFWELATRPLEYQQKAPIGYLWSVKALITFFGNSQQSLRLFSLLGGIASLFVFVPVARYFLKSWGVVAAVATLALSSPCIYHAVEAKQYGTELLAVVLALWLYTRYYSRTDPGSLVAWGVCGGILLWFSFSLIFVVAGMALALCWNALVRKSWKSLFQYAIPCSLWLLSFALQYGLIISKYHQAGWLIDYFDRVYNGFMPFPPSLAAAKWVFHKLYTLLLDPLGLLLEVDGDLAGLTESPLRYLIKMGWLHGFCLVLGAGVLLRKDKLNFAVLTLPLVLVLAASGARVYPFHERFLLFLAPLLIILVALGVQTLHAWLTYRRPWVFRLLMLLFFAPTVFTAARQLNNPNLMMNAEFNRETILFVNENFREGDVVYVFWNMSQAYEYYKLAYPLRYTAVQGGYVKNISRDSTDYLHNLAPDFQRFKGHKRLWYIYDRTNFGAMGDYVKKPDWYHRKGFYAPEMVARHFATLGTKLQQHRESSYTVVLYELNSQLAAQNRQTTAHAKAPTSTIPLSAVATTQAATAPKKHRQLR